MIFGNTFALKEKMIIANRQILHAKDCLTPDILRVKEPKQIYKQRLNEGYLENLKQNKTIGVNIKTLVIKL